MEMRWRIEMKNLNKYLKNIQKIFKKNKIFKCSICAIY